LCLWQPACAGVAGSGKRCALSHQGDLLRRLVAGRDLKLPAIDPFTVTAQQPGRDNRTGAPASTVDLPRLNKQHVLDSIDAALNAPPGSKLPFGPA